MGAMTQVNIHQCHGPLAQFLTGRLSANTAYIIMALTSSLGCNVRC